MQEINVRELVGLISSTAPVPGGGSVAALSGAFAAALSAMVGGLTAGKKGYETVWPQMAEITAKGKELQYKLLEAMDADAASFDGFMSALSLPRGTEEEKAARRAAMEAALKEASLAPLNTARLAAEVFPLAEAVVRSGNKNAVTDGLVAAMLARASVLGVLLNVKINLGSIRDQDFASDLRRNCLELQEYAVTEEKRILDLAPELK